MDRREYCWELQVASVPLIRDDISDLRHRDAIRPARIEADPLEYERPYLPEVFAAFWEERG